MKEGHVTYTLHVYMNIIFQTKFQSFLMTLNFPFDWVMTLTWVGINTDLKSLLLYSVFQPERGTWLPDIGANILQIKMCYDRKSLLWSFSSKTENIIVPDDSPINLLHIYDCKYMTLVCFQMGTKSQNKRERIINTILNALKKKLTKLSVFLFRSEVFILFLICFDNWFH